MLDIYKVQLLSERILMNCDLKILISCWRSECDSNTLDEIFENLLKNLKMVCKFIPG